MKLSEFVNTRPLLEKLAAMEMEGAAAKKFAEFVVELLKPIQEFEQKRFDLFKKYGVEEGEGAEAKLVIPEENDKKFQAAIKRLMNKDYDIEPFDLGSAGINVAPADLINALPLFK